jgi:hypothetical protein
LHLLRREINLAVLGIVYPHQPKLSMKIFLRQALGSLFVLLCSLPHPGYSQSFGTPMATVNPLTRTGGALGQYTSMQIVNGNPAIVTYDATRGNLYFIRATNASGTAWGTPQTVAATGLSGTYTSLQIVNGNPAIAYYDVTNTNLKFVRATDANGTGWSTPQSWDVAGSQGSFLSLQLVNGNPALSYYDADNADLKLLRLPIYRHNGKIPPSSSTGRQPVKAISIVIS